MSSRKTKYNEPSFMAFIGQFKWAIFAMIVVLVLSVLALGNSESKKTAESDVEYWKEKTAYWKKEAQNANTKLLVAQSDSKKEVLIPKGTLLESTDMETWSINHVPSEPE